jgi:hypothetical protein
MREFAEWNTPTGRPMHKTLKRALGAGILGGAAYAAWRAWIKKAEERPRGVEWSTAPFPFPPVPRDASGAPATAAAPPEQWVEPNADGSCPTTHPIKAKLASGIYHSPGGLNYARTKPDRCYADEAAAAGAGLRPSKV